MPRPECITHCPAILFFQAGTDYEFRQIAEPPDPEALRTFAEAHRADHSDVAYMYTVDQEVDRAMTAARKQHAAHTDEAEFFTHMAVELIGACRRQKPGRSLASPLTPGCRSDALEAVGQEVNIRGYSIPTTHQEASEWAQTYFDTNQPQQP